MKQLKEYVKTNCLAEKLYRQFQQAELPVQKMIASQWIERVTVFSYEHIDVQFEETEDIFSSFKKAEKPAEIV